MEEKDNLSKIFGFIAVILLTAVITGYFFQKRTEQIIMRDYVSIHKYHFLQKRVNCLVYENSLKNTLLFDALVMHQLDSSLLIKTADYVPQSLFLSKKEIQRMKADSAVVVSMKMRNELPYKLDSTYAEYHQSIAFMFMDAKHDSAWVRNSDTYKTIMDMVNTLQTRNKPKADSIQHESKLTPIKINEVKKRKRSGDDLTSVLIAF